MKKSNTNSDDTSIVEEIPEPAAVSPDETSAKEIEEWKQKYIRALADYQNLEKRAAAREDEIRKFAGEVILRKLLSPLDTLEQAAKHLDDEGLRLSLKELVATLTSVGVKRMNVVKQPFDPYTMECVDVIEGENEVVMEEVTPGYTYFDKVLRVAQVKVGKNANKL